MTFAGLEIFGKTFALAVVAVALNLSTAEAYDSCGGAYGKQILNSAQFAHGQLKPKPVRASDIRIVGGFAAIRNPGEQISSDPLPNPNPDTWVFVDRRSMREIFRLNSPADLILLSESYVAIQAVRPKGKFPLAWNIYRLRDGELVTSVMSRAGEISLEGSILRLANPGALYLGNGNPRAVQPVEIDLDGLGD
jgi:hypothetical protein